LPAASFDLILCTEVIEHIRGSQAALCEMHRLLRPGGTLILSTPQRYSPLELTSKIAFLPGIIDLVRLVYQEPVLVPGHINLMTEAEVSRQVVAAGFEIRERHKSGMYLPLVAEFMGVMGLRFEQWLVGRIQDGIFDRFLWTQYYVATA
jgi:2-polyprenyl-3-methyl-5-hydroxy-6-metoxy-1,4-benzoquinol methylase